MVGTTEFLCNKRHTCSSLLSFKYISVDFFCKCFHVFTYDFIEESSGRIVYDDRAIDALLDRSNEGIMEKESGMDDYLSSFKVCNFLLLMSRCNNS